jgi:hypothetical protein
MFGSGLGSGQLNATANVPGTFSYTPAIGSVPAIGSQVLTAVFTPSDSNDYVAVSTSTTINVLPSPQIAPMQLLITQVLARDTKLNVVAQLTLTNTSSSPVNGVVLTTVKLGVVGSPQLPLSIGSIGARSSVTVLVDMGGTVGLPGTATSLSLAARTDGGSVTSSARVKLP